MDSINQSHLILLLITTAWCFLHSAMISVSVTRLLEKYAGIHYRFYRLFFNSVALLTIIPVILYQRSIASDAFFNWDGYLRVVQFAMIGLGIVLFLLGAKKYDAKRFIGLAQLKDDTVRQGLSADGKLDSHGVHGLVRHPWYTGLLLVLWARPLDMSTLVINLVFSLYLIIGSHLEERKLVMEFGDDYRTYQKNVSMLLPFKWLGSKFRHH